MPERLPVPTGGRVVALIDAEADAPTLTAFLLQAALRGEISEVVLLNIQPKPDPVATRGLFAGEIRGRLEMVGRRRLAPAAKALSDAGVVCETRVQLADGALDVVACAHELGCDRIVVVTPELGPIGRAWLRATGCAPSSTALQVIARSDIPVLVLKRAVQ